MTSKQKFSKYDRFFVKLPRHMEGLSIHSNSTGNSRSTNQNLQFKPMRIPWDHHVIDSPIWKPNCYGTLIFLRSPEATQEETIEPLRCFKYTGTFIVGISDISQLVSSDIFLSKHFDSGNPWFYSIPTPFSCKVLCEV